MASMAKRTVTLEQGGRMRTRYPGQLASYVYLESLRVALKTSVTAA